MSAVAASLQTELDADASRVFACVELGSTPYRYAESDVDVTSLGSIQGKLTRPIPSYSRGLSIDCRLQSTEIEIEVSDDDLSISKEVAGYGTAQLVLGATAKVRIGALTSSVAPGSWTDDWTGIVADIPRMVRERLWAIRLRTNDLPLDRPCVGPGWILSRASFPLAPAESLDQMAPIVLGIHDSTGTTGTGAIPLIRVGPGVYLASAGGLYSVDRVYVAGEAQSSGWTAAKSIVNGRLYTLVTFTTDPAKQADGTIDESTVVAADVHGLTSVGDGSGTTVTDPVDALTILANNFWWGSWKYGAWDTTSAPIDATTWASCKTFLAAMSFGGHQAARRINGQARQLPTARNLFEEWCAGLVVYPAWTGAGTIALRVKDHTKAWTYADTPWIRSEDMLRPDGGEAADSVAASYASRRVDRCAVSFLVVDGETRQNLEVRDQSISGAGSDAVTAAWGRASAL